MRIGIVTGSFLPRVGGLEWKIHFLATEYHRHGHDVVVFHATPPLCDDGPFPVRAPYKIVAVGPRPFPGYGRLGISGFFFNRSLLFHHRRRPFDILHCHSLELPTRHGVRMKQMTGLPVVATTCGHDILTYPALDFGIRLRPYYDKVVRENANQVDVIGSISSSVTKELRGFGAKARIANIPNGVDWPTFQASPNVWLKQRLGMDPKDALVLSLGRNHPVKDYANGIRAFANISKKKNRHHYALIGKGTAILGPLVNELGLEKRVHLLDMVSLADIPQILWGIDIFFSPSLIEGFAQVVAQAMACARACVLSDCPGNEDLLGHPGSIFGRAGDPVSLSQALKQLVYDPERRKQIGQQAHTASLRFAWSSIADCYLKIFEELLARRNIRST